MRSALDASMGAGGLRDPSIDLLRRTIAGEFTDPDYLSGQIEAAAAPSLRNLRRSILPSIAGRFAASGRTGSGVERGAFEDVADITSRSIAETAQRAIGAERGRQQQAAGVFPQIAASDRATALAQQGVTRDLQQTSQLPLQRLLQIAGAIPSLYQTESRGGTPGKPGKGSALGSIAGTALGGFAGPLGAGAGAALGGRLFGNPNQPILFR